MKNQINVFIGYQFISSRYTRSELDKIFIDSLEKAENDINAKFQDKIKIRPILQDLLSGKAIFSQILLKISDADFCIFELSDLNPNVMLELGYALGLKKLCILLQHNEEKISSIPSDLSGLFVIKYDHETLGAKVAYEIHQNSINIINMDSKKNLDDANKNEKNKILNSFWNIDHNDKIYIICPEIPLEERKSYAETRSRDYLRLARFADIDSLYNMKDFISRKSPNAKIFEYTSAEMPEEAYDENIILIGGPAWNKVTKLLMERIQSPFHYIDGGKGNDDPIIEKDLKQTFLPKLDKDGSLKYDYGIFIKIPNPFNKKKSLMIINGIRTYGVLGATKCFTNDDRSIDNCNMIFRLLGKTPYFAALIKIAIINYYVAPPNLSSDLISLYSFNPIEESFCKVK